MEKSIAGPISDNSILGVRCPDFLSNILYDLIIIIKSSVNVKKDAPVGQRPRRVVVLVVAGECADVWAVSVAAMQHRDLREPAVDPAFAAAGDEHDAAVRQVGWLNVVEEAGG